LKFLLVVLRYLKAFAAGGGLAPTTPIAGPCAHANGGDAHVIAQDGFIYAGVVRR